MRNLPMVVEPMMAAHGSCRPLDMAQPKVVVPTYSQPVKIRCICLLVQDEVSHTGSAYHISPSSSRSLHRQSEPHQMPTAVLNGRSKTHEISIMVGTGNGAGPPSSHFVSETGSLLELSVFSYAARNAPAFNPLRAPTAMPDGNHVIGISETTGR